MKSGYEIAIDQIEEKYTLEYGTYIVDIDYKYDFETNYQGSYEIMEFTPDRVEWFNDWNEGQQDIIVQGILPIDELPPTMFHYINRRAPE